LKCAVDGCSAEESQAILCELGYADCVTDGDPTSLVGEEVQGLELGSNSLEYYYTFGSALAFYSGTEEYPQGCRDAERVFQQLMNRYGQDPIVAGIVSENRAICARLGATSGSSPTEISPTSTPQP
jgi:hypothetical protein